MGTVYKRGKVWWIQYYRDGRAFRESSGSDRFNEAKDLLKSREGDIAKGAPVTPKANRLLLAEILQDVVIDYRKNRYKTLNNLQTRIGKHLLPWFGERCKAQAVTPSMVDRYAVSKQEAGLSNAEINRHLSVLVRAFTLAARNGKLPMRPHIGKLREDNVRKGFFERDQFEAVCRHLPEEIRDLVRFAYVTGWRIRSEVQTLRWSQVDLEAGWVRLDAGTTKNRRGRDFPITADLKEILERRKQASGRMRRRGAICPWVFHREGQPIRSFYRVWRTACKKAGAPGRIPHDLRRTAVRNLVRAGVPEKVAMTLTGHRSRSVFDRYDIGTKSDLAEAGRRLDLYRQTQLQTQSAGNG